MVAAKWSDAFARAERRARRAVEWAGRRRRRAREAHGLVLMYHRIASVAVDPWRLAVSPSHFADQLRVLRQHADIVPLTGLRGQLRLGRRSRPVIAITFDDGYLDNLTAAKPLLERFEAPATVFVAMGLVDRAGPFWWDRLANLCLNVETLPGCLDAMIGGSRLVVKDPELELGGYRGQRARRRLHDDLWDRLANEQSCRRDEVIVMLERWANTDPLEDPEGRAMTGPELRQLMSGGLVELGAHTVTHPRLSRLAGGQKAIEIERSREDCADIMGRPPAAFAFPNGDLDEESVDCVRQAGFELACTSRQDLVWDSGDAYRIPRISVRDEGGEAMWRRLDWQWLP